MTKVREKTPEEYAAELEEYRQACISIDREDMNAERIRLPSDLAFWGERYAEAVEAHQLACESTKATYATAFVLLDSGTDQRTGKPMAVERVKHFTEQEPSYREAAQSEARAAGEKMRAYAVIEAIKAKQNMLQELGATARRELDATGRYGET